MLKRLIFGKYINTIEKLNKENERLEKELYTALNKNQKLVKDAGLVYKARDTIEKIENNIRPAHLDINSEFKLKLHQCDNNYLEVVIATQPVLIDAREHFDMCMKTKQINLETRIGYTATVGEEVLKEASHELCVEFAHIVGDKVKDFILKKYGWRV